MTETETGRHDVPQEGGRYEVILAPNQGSRSNTHLPGIWRTETHIKRHGRDAISKLQTTGSAA